MYKSNTPRSEVNQISGKDPNIGYNFKNTFRRGLGQVPMQHPYSGTSQTNLELDKYLVNILAYDTSQPH